MAKKNPPCIKNLERYKKTGCPEKCWDGEDGCTAWIEQTVGSKDNPLKPEVVKKCVDMWNFSLLWSMLGQLEGNKQAIESFRNGMVEIDDSGKTRPKADPAVVNIVQMIHSQIQKKNIEDQYKAKQLAEENL
jgi:hypothetical protein